MYKTRKWWTCPASRIPGVVHAVTKQSAAKSPQVPSHLLPFSILFHSPVRIPGACGCAPTSLQESLPLRASPPHRPCFGTARKTSPTPRSCRRSWAIPPSQERPKPPTSRERRWTPRSSRGRWVPLTSCRRWMNRRRIRTLQAPWIVEEYQEKNNTLGFSLVL